MVPLVYLSPVAWQSIRQRPHHLAVRLARHFDLTWVDPVGLRPVGLADLARLWPGRPRDVVTNLPFPCHRVRYWPLGTGGPLASVNHRWLARQASRFVPFQQPWILWASTPSLLAETLTDGHFSPPPQVIVYDCMDHYAAFHWGRTVQRIEAAERQLAARAHIVFGSCHTLVAKLAQAGPKAVEWLPNGVDTEPFRRAALEPPAEFLQSLPRPIIGYQGVLANWLDYDLLAQLARLRPDWSWVLVGPVHARQARALNALQNVYLPGEIPYARLPAWTAGFDAGIVPFVQNELTHHVLPLKALEYLAAGVPVVSSPLPSLVEWQLVRTATGPEDWLAALTAACGERRAEPQIRARQAWAQQFGWDQIADQAIQRLRAAWEATASQRHSSDPRIPDPNPLITDIAA